MSQTMIQAAVTMGQLQNKLDLIGNNLANSETTGYKSRQADFSSLLYREINNLSDPKNQEGRLTPDQLRTGTGARLGAISLNMQTGTIADTGRSLDAALTKANHFFQVQTTENGQSETRYTRDGAFYLNPSGRNNEMMLVTKNGHPVLGVNGPIRIAAGYEKVDIAADGALLVTRNGVTRTEGQIQVVEAVRPRSLDAAGDNMYRLPQGRNAGIIRQVTGQETGDVMRGGALEQSNVDMAQEMTEMINIQRSYQFNARTLSMGDQMQGLVNQLR